MNNIRLINANNFIIVKCPDRSKDFVDGANYVLELIHNEPTAFDLNSAISEINEYAHKYGVTWPSIYGTGFETYVRLDFVTDFLINKINKK